MMKKAGLSPAEQSQQATKAALERHAEEKKFKEEKSKKRQTEHEETRKRKEEELQYEAAIIGHRLYLLLRDRIKEEEGRGHLKLEGYLGNFVPDEKRDLLHWAKERFTCLAFNHAAKRLREGGYQVRFGRFWSYENDRSYETPKGINWSGDATAVPYDLHYARTSVGNLIQHTFPNINIEVDWGEEESK